MRRKQTRPYRCIECGNHFSESEAKRYDFFKATNTCFNCYEKGQSEDHRVWCFGKRDKRNNSGKIVRWGHDPTRPECKRECPDRKICRVFLTRKDKETGERYRKIDRIKEQKS